MTEDQLHDLEEIKHAIEASGLLQLIIMCDFASIEITQENVYFTPIDQPVPGITRRYIKG